MLKCSFGAIIWPLLAVDQDHCTHRTEVIKLLNIHFQCCVVSKMVLCRPEMASDCYHNSKTV